VSGFSTPLPIRSQDDLAVFDSGEPSLDDWLRKRALTNQSTGASRCFVTGEGIPAGHKLACALSG